MLSYDWTHNSNETFEFMYPGRKFMKHKCLQMVSLLHNSISKPFTSAQTCRAKHLSTLWNRELESVVISGHKSSVSVKIIASSCDLPWMIVVRFFISWCSIYARSKKVQFKITLRLFYFRSSIVSARCQPDNVDFHVFHGDMQFSRCCFCFWIVQPPKQEFDHHRPSKTHVCVELR